MALRAARRDAKLNEIYERETARGNAKQTTIAVARRLVGCLVVCDRENRAFRPEKNSRQPLLKPKSICNARRPDPARAVRELRRRLRVPSFGSGLAGMNPHPIDGTWQVAVPSMDG